MTMDTAMALAPAGADTDTAADDGLDVAADLADALRALDDAEDGYEEAQTYYEGKAEEKFLSPLTRKLLTGSSRDFNINLTSRIVDAVLDRMEIGAVTAEPASPDGEPVDEEEGPGTGQAGAPEDQQPDQGDAEDEAEVEEEENEPTRLVNQIWHDNELDLEVPEIHEKALSLGDAYLFVWPEQDDSGRVTGVEIYYNSPMSVRVLYDAEKPRRKRLAVKRWQVGAGKDARVRVNLYYPGTPGRVHKLVSDKRAATKPSDFRAFVDDHTDENGVMEFPWDFEELPFFHFRTVRPYGRPEHARAYGAQDAATKIIKGMMAGVDFTAFPQRYALTEPGAATDDDTDWGDDDTAAPEDLESSLIAKPGNVWVLRYIKQVGQFASADMDNFLKPLNWVVGGMAAVTGTPISQFRQLLGASGQMPSGASQMQDKDALLKKTSARQRSFAATWRDALQFALRLLGVDAVVTIHWKPPEIISGKEAWEGVRAQQQAGVPVRQTLLEAGYTEAEVTSWGYTEDDPDGPGMDMSQFGAPPPVPGAANPFEQQGPPTAAAPPAPSAPPGGEGQEP